MKTIRAVLAATLVVASFGVAVAKLPPAAPMTDVQKAEAKAKADAAADLAKQQQARAEDRVAAQYFANMKAQGKVVPSQRLASGELVFLARNVPAFSAQRLEIRDSSGTKALPREDADFDFRLIEPASVGGCVVNREAVPDLIANLHTEDVRQRLAAVDVEVVHDQVDGLCLRVLHRQVAGDLCELKG